MDGHRAWGWRIVNYAKYRSIKDEDDRREQNRRAQAEWRAKQAESKLADAVSSVSNSKQPSADVITNKQRKPESAHVEADAEGEVEADAEACTDTPPGPETDFPPDSAESPASKLAMRVVEAWNSFEILPKVRDLTSARKKALKARLREKFFLENFEEAIRKISQSDFCTGRTTGQNGWLATFDWLLKPDTAARVMEGKYDNRGGKKAGPTEFALSADEKPKVKTF
jgi:hypothetical protein